MTDSREIIYEFRWPSGHAESVSVSLTEPHLLCADALSEDPPPEWTRLGFHKCTNCPLKESQHTHCPAAVKLSPVIKLFGERISHEQVEVIVHTDARTFTKSLSLQHGLGSLFGLILATAGCPILDRLRPMVYLHLPFANGRETAFRAIATYLTAQAVKERRGEKADWSMTGLTRIYDEVHWVNMDFAGRIRNQSKHDAGINAVVTLDALADITLFTLSEDRWNSIEPLFAPASVDTKTIHTK